MRSSAGRAGAVLALVVAVAAAVAGAIGRTPPASGQAPADAAVTIRPVFPRLATVGQQGVPAALELTSMSLLPVVVTGLSVVPSCAAPPAGADCRATGAVRLAGAAAGSGSGCPGTRFAVVGPDPGGRYVLDPSPPMVFPPLANLGRPTCTIDLTFDVVDVGPGPDVYPLATLTGLAVPPLVGTAWAWSTMAVNRSVIDIAVAPVAPIVPARAPLQASARVSAAGAEREPPGGTVAFSLHGPGDDDCRGEPLLGPADRPVAPGEVVGPVFTPTAAGTYHWVARYSGDATHNPADSGCGAPTTVLSAGTLPAPTTTVAAVVATVPPPPPPPPATPPPAPPPLVTPPPGPHPAAVPGALAPFDPAAHADEVVAVQVSAFALLALLGAAGGGAVARAAAGGGAVAARPRSMDDDRGQAEFVSTGVDRADAGLGGRGYEPTWLKWGDRAPTWSWPGLVAFDRASRRWPERTATGSPLLARILNDAGYLRAMFGPASLLLVGAGAALGALAVREVGGDALPPSFATTMGLAVLGVFDALAGIVAVTVFVGGVVLAGGLSSADAARTLLGLTTLWFAAPLIAGVARPLRRPPTTTLEEHFDRSADVVIASLVGAAAVYTILGGLPALSGLDLPIAGRAAEGALVVLVALAGRMLVETIAAHGFPRRLAQVQPATLPEPGPTHRLAANLLVLAVFLFVAASFLGSCWQLYVGGAIFVLPRVLGLIEDRLPSVPRLATVTPRGIVVVVVLLVVGGLVSAYVLGRFDDGRQLLRYAFVILAVPGLVVSVLELLGRDGPQRQLRWYHQLAGIPLLVLGVLLTLGIVG